MAMRGASPQFRGASKSKATSYTDFFKGKSVNPESEDEDETDPRKAALKRRLKASRAARGS